MITQQNEVHFSAFLKSTELFLLLLHKNIVFCEIIFSKIKYKARVTQQDESDEKLTSSIWQSRFLQPYGLSSHPFSGIFYMCTSSL